jgi:hypothetical protein
MDKGRKSSESISIGVNAFQMMMLAERRDPAMLPTAQPRARKAIMPRKLTPTKVAAEPGTRAPRKPTPMTATTRIVTTTKASWLREKPTFRSYTKTNDIATSLTFARYTGSWR